MRVFTDERGTLLPVDLYELPFIPRRVFVVCDVPEGVWRGDHAHKTTWQMLVCVTGLVQYELWDGKSTKCGILQQGETVLIPSMVWDKQRFTHGTVMLVLCSTVYDPDDYIRNKEQFNALVDFDLSRTTKSPDVGGTGGDSGPAVGPGF